MMLGTAPGLSPVTLIQQDSGDDATPHLKKVSHYTLRAKIGYGSSCTVYLGTDDRSAQLFAIKRIRLRELARTSAGVAQLEREIRLMHLFQHPNIIRILEVLHVQSTDEAYLVLEYAANGSLGGFIERNQSLPHPAIFSVMRQMLEAIKYLHNAGYVHQDIKPCNILIDSDGIAKLADFGIGHSFDSAAMVVGSPAYQAPEALDDSYGADDDSGVDCPQKEDIWAMGVTFFQLLFQRLPFVGDNLYEIIRSINEQPLEIPEECDPEVAVLLRRMLDVNPLKRADVDELLAHPIFMNAPARAEGLPGVPPPIFKVGEIIELEAKVCSDGFSFANLPLSVPRRFSYHVPGRDGSSRTSNRRPSSHSDGDGDQT
jgi:serine/threonine-protein kinase 11